MNTKLLSLILVYLVLYSCKKEEGTTLPTSLSVEESQTIPVREEAINDEEEDEDIPYIPEDKEVSFPQTGFTVEDFVPSSSHYIITDRSEADINGDGLNDIAILLKHKYDPNASRPILILFKKEDNSYFLKTMSRVARQSPYSGYTSIDEELSEFEIFNTPTAKGISISTYFLPRGNTYTTYEYIESEFILTLYGSYGSGSGSIYETIYKPLTGEYTLYKGWYDSTTEEEKESTETEKRKPQKFFFETTDPGVIDE